MPPVSRPRRRPEDGDRLWWRDGVIYQIYPRSFMDSNGDGVGDLEGIRQRLDHVEELGVDGIWISPCFPSPMKDFGYDVSDYCDIDPLFGTLDDFDRLLADAHGRGIRVVLDLVPNHSSDQHEWFRESRASRDNPRRDWYVWRDPKPDGSPPNNWKSVFGGPAWELDPATGQYYLHTFLREQPELDWRNPEVVAAMHDVVRFWFDRGVDGFRIDVIHALAKDPAMRDDPVVDGVQRRVHSEDHEDVHEIVRGLRRVADEYEERALIGEVYLMDPERVARYYGDGDELHIAFNFSFMRAPWDAGAFQSEVERFQALVPEGSWPNHVLSSHDAPRHASRYDHPELGDSRARLAAMMLLTLRGTPFLYYGEEIGMRNVAIPEDAMQDPIGRTLHPKLCRDGERTPMLWEPGEGAGFTTGEPWLPIGPDAAERNTALQLEDDGSILGFYRRLLALRRLTPALERGSMRVLEAGKGVLAYERRLGSSRAFVALNFGDGPATVDLPEGGVSEAVLTGGPSGPVHGKLDLGPSESALILLA